MLIDWGALSREQLAHALAERFGLDYVDLSVFQADLAAVNLISPQAAKRFDAVPIGFDESGALIVAMADPSNVLALDDLKLMTGHEVRPAVASAEDIAGVIGAHEPPGRGRGERDRGRRTRTTTSRRSPRSASPPRTRR